MKYNKLNKGMFRRLAAMAALLLSFTAAMAQITAVSGTVSDDMGPLMAAVVCEVDANERIIESTLTDMNGNFTMRIHDSKKNKLKFQYVGMKTQILTINKEVYNITLASDVVLDVVEVKAQRRWVVTTFPFPSAKSLSLLRHWI